MANISNRKYIYYLPHPLPPTAPIPYTAGLPHTNPLNLPPTPSEPTSTLVLTTPSNHFVDLRILKPLFPGDPALPNESSLSAPANSGAPTQVPADQPNAILNRDRLEWGFAGHSRSVPAPDLGEGVNHSVWTHWLDSKFHAFSAEIPIDEGDMYPILPSQPQDPELTLEHGASRDPRTGKWIAYEEMWEDEPVRVVREEEGKVAAMMRVEDGRKMVRGMVVRVGQYVQGIIMQGEECVVERWEFVEKEGQGKGAMWTRTVKIGEHSLPCAILFNVAELYEGATVSVSNLEWKVEELAHG